MLTRWLTNRPSRKAKKAHCFRPWLESLEERNAPGGGPHGGGNDQGDNDQGHHGPPPPPAPPPASVNNSISSNINAHGSFNNSTITDSFNNTINVAVNLPAAQSGAVTGLLGISNLLSSALSNPQLATLLHDEIALAVDNYLTGTPAIASVLGSTVVNDLKTDAATLTVAIAANPLESDPIGAAVGTFVYELTASALTSAQPKI
jgi:hypothetical protein